MKNYTIKASLFWTNFLRECVRLYLCNVNVGKYPNLYTKKFYRDLEKLMTQFEDSDYNKEFEGIIQRTIKGLINDCKKKAVK